MVIAFITLFLGLTAGSQDVRIAVGRGVATVEVSIDDQRYAVLDGEPWRVSFDFGNEIVPRHLVAVAFDAAGEEMGRAEQWLNLPHGAADVNVVLDSHVPGQERLAHLSWETTTGGEPQSIEATFDGAPVPIVDGRRLVLPPHDLAALHFLRVAVDFGGGVEPVEEIAFGGTYGEEVSTELTAIPILVERGREAPSVESLEGLLLRRGEPLRVTAVDRGPAEIVFLKNRGFAAPFEPSKMLLRRQVPLPRKTSLRFLSMVPQTFQGVSAQFALYRTSREFTTEDAGFYLLASRFRFDDERPEDQRVNGAVAVAGLNSFNSHSRRAVVLMLRGEVSEEASVSAAAVRRYLRRLHVPLFVWSPDRRKQRASHAEWGEAREVMTIMQFGRAADEVYDHLDRQWIVWLDGRHLPQEIVLAGDAEGLSLVYGDG